MALEAIYSFLTHPKKNSPESPVDNGTEIPISENKLNQMLSSIFHKADQDCRIPIQFTTDKKQQENPVRTALMKFVDAPSVATASPLALRLQQSTSGTSGMGLLFLCIGTDRDKRRVVLSRFPADEGVVAERSSSKLTVQFVEQVFMKSAKAYKAATYLVSERPDRLWKGHVVDRQVSHSNKTVADYWIVDFLMSDFATTSAAGTKRLATALRSALGATSNLVTKGQISAAAQLAAHLPSEPMSIAGFCEKYHFTDETKQLVLSKAGSPRLAEDRFRFDAGEFVQHLAFMQVELSNGAVLSAPSDRFYEVFARTPQTNEACTFSTTGRIVDQRLRKVR